MAEGDALFYRDPIAHLAAVVAATRTYAGMAARLMRPAPPDFLAVYLEGIDTLSHRFVRDRRRGPPALARAYRDADDLVARLAALSPPDALIVVCSDHGFHPAEAGVAEDPADLAGAASAWHRPYGIVAAAEAGVLSGRGAATPQDVGTVTPVDIAPTVLHAAGLPIPREMPGRVVSALLPADVATRTVVRGPTPAWSPPAESADMAAADPETVARLRALGYMGTSTTSLARLNLGEVLYRRGRLEAAEREFRAVVEAQPANLGAQLWWARTLRDLRRNEQALRAYGSALRLEGDTAEAAVEAAELAVASGQAEEGRRLAALAPARSPGTATARAVLARAAGDVAGAEREYRAALARDPAFFPALARLVDLLLESHRAAEAVPLARAAAARVPASARHLGLLGEVLLAARDPRGAEDALLQALALAPDATTVRVELARAQLAQGKAREAEATLLSAPDSVERSLLLGAAASTQGRWTEAVAGYESALAAGGPTPELLNGLGWARFKLGQAERAAELLRRSLSLKRDQPEIRRLLTQIETGGGTAPRP
jgi:tetratricopeptide (TPR) repeat protein